MLSDRVLYTRVRGNTREAKELFSAPLRLLFPHRQSTRNHKPRIFPENKNYPFTKENYGKEIKNMEKKYETETGRRKQQMKKEKMPKNDFVSFFPYSE